MNAIQEDIAAPEAPERFAGAGMALLQAFLALAVMLALACALFIPALMGLGHMC